MEQRRRHRAVRLSWCPAAAFIQPNSFAEFLRISLGFLWVCAPQKRSSCMFMITTIDERRSSLCIAPIVCNGI